MFYIQKELKGLNITFNQNSNIPEEDCEISVVKGKIFDFFKYKIDKMRNRFEYAAIVEWFTG